MPLLTVETEANEDSKSTNERGPALVASLVLSCRYKRFSFCLGCSRRPSTKYFFPHRTSFQFLCPHRPASWAGSRAGSPVSQYMHCKGTIPKIRNKYSQERNCAATVPIPKFIFLCAIYIFLWSVCLFCSRKKGGPNVGLYRSRTDTWMWKLRLRLRNSFSGKI